jgi:hypothetical protein
MERSARFLAPARVADQKSRLSAVRWARHHCVAEILGQGKFNEKDLYRALNWLAQHRDKTEENLFRISEEEKGARKLRWLAVDKCGTGWAICLAEYGGRSALGINSTTVKFSLVGSSSSPRPVSYRERVPPNI